MAPGDFDLVGIGQNSIDHVCRVDGIPPLGGKDVMLWGGGHVAQQYLAAGLLDELELHVVPVLLGGGSRLLDNLGDADVRLEQVRAVEAPGVTHLKYRILPGAPS